VVLWTVFCSRLALVAPHLDRARREAFARSLLLLVSESVTSPAAAVPQSTRNAGAHYSLRSVSRVLLCNGDFYEIASIREVFYKMVRECGQEGARGALHAKKTATRVAAALRTAKLLRVAASLPSQYLTAAQTVSVVDWLLGLQGTIAERVATLGEGATNHVTLFELHLQVRRYTTQLLATSGAFETLLHSSSGSTSLEYMGELANDYFRGKSTFPSVTAQGGGERAYATVALIDEDRARFLSHWVR
jgi:hypothetical protein